MTFDGFFIYHLVLELNTSLSKSRLEKIYQSDSDAFLFVFYLKGERKNLSIRLNPNRFGIYITEHEKNATISSQFLQTLKKHLEGAILEKIVQHLTDRVVILKFTVYDFIDGPIQKEIIFEAMGRHSNLMLIQEGIIIDTYKKMFFDEGRQLLPQATFEFFPSHKKPFTELSYDSIFEPMDLVNSYLGISPFLAQYLFESRQHILDIIPKPTRDLELNKEYVFDHFESTHEKIYYPTISKMLDDHLEVKKDLFISHRQFVQSQLKKLNKKKAQFEFTLEQANLQLNIKQSADMIYQLGIPLDEKMTTITYEGQTIALDATKTLNENAQLLYKSYHKAKRSMSHIINQINDIEILIDFYLGMEIYISFANSDQIKDIETDLIPYGFKGSKLTTPHKKKKDTPKILKLEEQDHVFFIGKNHVQNEYLTHQVALKNDYWFHVKDAPGAHVVLRTNLLNEYSIRKASMLAAYFSSLKYSSSIPVDYTQIKHLKKIPGTPGYKVTYKSYQTIYIDIDEKTIESYLKNV